MANNKSIQFLRGDTASIAACNDVSLAGQPVFNTETKELLIGDGSTQIKNLDGIKVSKAEEANKLSTAGTVKVNLESTSSPTYTNGGNITPGVSGTLPIANGGTGMTSAPSLQVNLSSTSAADILTASPRPGVTGTLPVARGGTGITQIPSLRVDLASESAASVFATSPRPGVTGILPVYHGGTGVTSLKTLSTVSDLGYDVIADRKKPITMEGMAFWNGAYQDNISNLTYCKGGEIVDTTTAQTIGGVKTFTGDNIVKAGFNRTTSGRYKFFDYLDSDNNRMGVIGVAAAPSNYYGAYIQAGNEGSIGIYSNGSDVYTSAPTPDASSNTTEIATTRWVNDRLESLGFNEGVITDSSASGISNTVNLSSYTLKRFGKAVLLESLYTTSSSSSGVRWRGQLSDPAFYPKTQMNINTGYRDYSGNPVILYVYTDGSMFVSYISSGSGGYAGVDNVGWEAA